MIFFALFPVYIGRLVKDKLQICLMACCDLFPTHFSFSQMVCCKTNSTKIHFTKYNTKDNSY